MAAKEEPTIMTPEPLESMLTLFVSYKNLTKLAHFLQVCGTTVIFTQHLEHAVENLSNLI